MKENGYYVIVTLTFNPRSPNSIGFEPWREATIQRKPHPNRCIGSAGILFTRSAGHTDTHTDTQTNCNENVTPPQFRGCVITSLTFLRPLTNGSGTMSYLMFTVLSNRSILLNCQYSNTRVETRLTSYKAILSTYLTQNLHKFTYIQILYDKMSLLAWSLFNLNYDKMSISICIHILGR